MAKGIIVLDEIPKSCVDCPMSVSYTHLAINLACEVIQVAAMSQKFIDSQKER